MKKITMLLLFLGITSLSSAQCLEATFGQYPFFAYEPENCDGLTENLIADDGYAGEYSAILVTEGQTYTFSSSIATDYLTVSEDEGATAAVSGIGSVTFVATVTGEIWLFNHLNENCGDEEELRTRTVICGEPLTEFAANDACENATQIPTGETYSFEQTDGFANTNNNGFLTTCSNGMNDGLWYSFEGDGNDVKIVISPEASFDPQLGVFTGVCGQFTCVGTADVGIEGESETYIVNASVEGITYYVNIGHWSASTNNPEGNFTIDVTRTTPATEVPGCVENVTPVDGAENVTVGDVVFSWEAPTTGGPVVSYNFYAGFELPLTEADLLGSTDETTATLEIEDYGTLIYWKAVPVNALGEAVDCATYSFTTESLPDAPANDACATATSIESFPFTDNVNANGATNNDGFISTCFGMNDGIWYTVVGNGNDIVINATTDIDGELGVYTGECGTFTCYEYADDELENGTETVTITASEVGTTYYINVGYYSGSTDLPDGIVALEVTSEVLGIDDNKFASFKAYPNPVVNSLNLSFDKTISNVAVFNLLGQQVGASLNADKTQVDMSNLSAGTYLVKVTAETGVKTIKVVKQ